MAYQSDYRSGYQNLRCMAELTAQDRNRENQRRSRERRQAYIQDLEQRVRDYERKGVQATAAVQVAARKVADENVRLRSLLTLHGVEGIEVEAYLADDKIPNLTQNLTQNTSSRQILGRVPGHTVPQIVDGSMLQHIGLNPYPTPPAAGHSRDIRAGLPVHQRHINGPRGNGSEGFVPGSAPGSTVLPAERDNTSLVSEAGDETSCEVAAQIIASMRGNEDPMCILPELGCGPEASVGQSCRVKNIDIFQIMDEG